jgi:L-cystine uptake protein TcyP (sodium:dicarboxylate symporter family)
MINTQLVNDALMSVAFVIGVAFALTVAMVTASALWQRNARRAGLRAVEQHLATVTNEAIPADAR